MSNLDLFNISINDFIEKWSSPEKKYFTREDIRKTNINIDKLNLLEFINILDKKSFLRSHQIYNILAELSKNYIPLLRKENGGYILIQKNWSEKKFNISVDIDNNSKQLYEESVEKYWFNNENSKIAIFKIDHSNKKIYTLIPAPIQDIYEKLKLIKTFNTVTTENKYRVKVEWGLEEDIKRKIDDYWIVYILAPIELIDEIHSRNIKLWMKLIQNSEVFSQKRELAWFWQTELGQKTVISDKKSWTIEQFISDILWEQVKKGWSDIHFEPLLHSEMDAWQVRIRINWKLSKPSNIPRNFWSLIRDMKEKTNLDVNKSNVPQDWKLTLIVEWIEEELNYRVSTIPIWEKWQEKVVMRKLSKDVAWLNLDSLKMDLDKRELLDDVIWNPKKGKNGKYRDWMILMTWPTGSGKSTTLFAILNQLNTNEVNIQTLEDPIEYELPWINQSQITDSTTTNTEAEWYTYSKWLRACLRQDPDIILVWEIRDEVTMEVSKHAAATWHLLLSSLHTNNTWETLDRLISLWFDITMVWNIIRLIMAQRLAGTVCPHCRLEYNNTELATNSKEQEERENEYLKRKMEIFRKLIDTPYVLDLPDKIEDLTLYEWKGCPECDYTWDGWRMWLYEFLPININIQNFLLKKWIKASKEEVRELFIKEGVTTLYQNAVLKTFKPFTDEKTKKDLYINYNSWISSAWWDMYWFWDEYLNMDIKELENLLQIRKTEKYLEKVQNDINDINFKITWYEKQQSVSKNKEKYKDFIITLSNKKIELIKLKERLELKKKKLNEI